jgi:hypothetical protein
MALFKKHYTREEARALLPQVRQWVGEIQALRPVLVDCEEQISAILKNGDDAGGPAVNRYLQSISILMDVMTRFQKREIQVKDLDRGLVDFPAYIGGKEVFLCWEHGEDDIEFWHDLESGYAGREKLE